MRDLWKYLSFLYELAIEVLETEALSLETFSEAQIQERGLDHK